MAVSAGHPDGEETAMKKRPKTVKAMFSSAEDGDEFTAMVKTTVADWALQKHPKTSPEEIAMLNAIPPGPCPRCGFPGPIRWGRSKEGIARYVCAINIPLLDAIGVFPEPSSKKAVFCGFFAIGS